MDELENYIEETSDSPINRNNESTPSASVDFTPLYDTIQSLKAEISDMRKEFESLVVPIRNYSQKDLPKAQTDESRKPERRFL